MLILNKQVKPAKNIFNVIFNAKTTIKHIHKKDNKTSRKKLTAMNVEFFKSLGFVYKISEMTDILNIESEPIFDDVVRWRSQD